MIAKFRCSGQACVAANRFYVQSNIYDIFISNLIEAVSKLKCGNGLDKDVTLGPIINQNSLDKVLFNYYVIELYFEVIKFFNNS